MMRVREEPPNPPSGTDPFPHGSIEGVIITNDDEQGVLRHGS